MGFKPRGFDQASLSGNPVGRPATTRGTEPSKYARALIAARRFKQKMPGNTIEPAARSSALSSQEISSLRGKEKREQDQFDADAQAPLEEDRRKPYPGSTSSYLP